MSKKDDRQEPSVAIYIEDASEITIGSLRASGVDIAVQGRNVSGLVINELHYDGPGVALDITGDNLTVRNGKAITTGTVEQRAKSYGYVKPKGPSLPAQCPRCESIFPSRHYNAAVPRFLTKNNKETCPICGFDGATLAEGVFNLVGEFVTVIEAEGLSEELLRAIGAAAKSTSKGQTNLDAALDMISEVSPSVADVLRQGLARQMAAGVLMILAAMASYNVAYDFNEKTGAIDFATRLYSEAAKIIVEKVGDHQYEVKQANAEEQPSKLNDGGQTLRKKGNELKNSTAMPNKIPVPIPRPSRP